MTENKRFKMEMIEGVSLPFIVDNDSAKKRSDKITSYHTYETDKKNKCLELVEMLNALHEENQQLRKELLEFKEWEKHIGDVQREDIDRIFKMSIFEIAEGFEYYKKRIKELEELLND